MLSININGLNLSEVKKKNVKQFRIPLSKSLINLVVSQINSGFIKKDN